MSFDPMAAAVDWLDAYRAGDIDSVLELYAVDAVVHCDCDGETIVGGRAGLRAYWQDRIQRCPATDLDALKPSGDGVAISYITPGGVVHARLTFNAEGQIVTCVCGPERQELRQCG